MANVIALIRTSTVAQEVESQKAEVMKYILEDGHTEDEIIVVGGAGASAIKVDEAYKKNINTVYSLIEQGGITAVYAFAIDRIGRNEEILFHFKNYLVNHGVQLVICNPSLRLLNADGTVNGGVELAFSLFSTMAKQEMENKKVRFRRGKNRNRENGKYNGGVLRFGYALTEDNRFIVHKENAQIVEDIFDMMDNGKSCTQIAQELNARGITKNGKKWSRLAIYNIIANGEEYTGEMALKLPVIIPSETYQRVRAKLSGNVKTAEKNKLNYLLGRLIVCPECGHNYIYHGGGYKCVSHVNSWDYTRDYDCTNATTIKSEVADFCALSVAKTCEMARFAEQTEEVKNELLEQIDINTKKIEALKAEVEKVADKKAKVANAWIDNFITTEEKDRRIARIKEKEREALAEIKRLENLNRQHTESFNRDDKIHLGALKTMNCNDYEQAKEIVKRHIEHVEIAEQGKTKKTIKIWTYTNGLHEFVYYPRRRKGVKLEYVAADRLKPLQIDPQNVPMVYA